MKERCLVKCDGEEYYGWLRGFGLQSEKVHDYCNQAVGVNTWTVAIIEREDGRLVEVEPRDVQIIRLGVEGC
jgi:hypothetical protein